MDQTDKILLWLFTLNLGTVFGAGIYEARLVIPLWFPRATGGRYVVDTSAMQTIDSGRRFWSMATTVPLTLLTIINVIRAWDYQSASPNWWLIAACLMLAERLLTFSFFIPNAIRVSKIGTTDPARAGRLAAWWIRANYFRNAMTLACWLLAMKALVM